MTATETSDFFIEDPGPLNRNMRGGGIRWNLLVEFLQSVPRETWVRCAWYNGNCTLSRGDVQAKLERRGCTAPFELAYTGSPTHHDRKNYIRLLPDVPATQGATA